MTQEEITLAQLYSEHSTLQFLLWGVYGKLFKRKLKVNHSLTDATFCADIDDEPITEEMSRQLHQGVLDILNSDTPIELIEVKRDVLIQHFTKYNFKDKIGLLKSWQDENIPCIRCGEFIDYTIQRMTTNKERLKILNS